MEQVESIKVGTIIGKYTIIGLVENLIQLSDVLKTEKYICVEGIIHTTEKVVIWPFKGLVDKLKVGSIWRVLPPKELKDIGWQVTVKNSPEYATCREKKHIPSCIDKSSSPYRGDHMEYTCEECGIIWHIDSSD